jgi:alkaline phosphatase D
MRINRRSLLSLIGVGAPTLGAESAAQAAVPTVSFDHGVASGDPLADRVVIWTRATPVDPTASVPVSWEVAATPNFDRILASGKTQANPVSDHTVKVDVGGLSPGHEYWYRFTVGAATSPIGRTKTLPTGKTDKVVLAFVTCALYPNGYFNAYDHIAKSERLDAVIELGDYIYEYGAKPDDYGMDNGQKLGRIPEPGHDLVTLADYRTRYAQYRRDVDLQAAHARAPWISVWDDHEVANDTWKGGAENHHEKTEGAFDDRKAAAMRAWYEWMPVRDPVPGRALEAINRSFNFGDLASLTMLETRLTARSYQLEYDRPGDIAWIVYDATDPAHRKPVRDPAITAKVKAETAATGKPPAPYVFGPDVEAIEAYVANPNRQMMGALQEAWLQKTLAASVAAGRPWQVIGNEVVMGRCRSPKIEAFVGKAQLDGALARMRPAMREEAEKLIDAMSYDQPFDLDGWDGYPAARARFDEILKSLGGGNTVVVSGDSHAFWANQLFDKAGEVRVALELGTSSITSPSIGDGAGFQLGAVFMAQNKEVMFCDQLRKGYVRLTLTPETAQGEMIAVPIDAKPYTSEVLATWKLRPTPGVGVGPIERV